MRMQKTRWAASLLMGSVKLSATWKTIHASASQPARAPQQVNATPRQPVLLAGVGIVRHHEIPPGQRGLNIDLRGRAGVARALHRFARAK